MDWRRFLSMNTKAIIFDKDGTLIDFDAFWVTISYEAIDDILRTLNCEHILQEEILSALGVKNGITDINGILCRGTYVQMGQEIYKVLNNYGCTCTVEEVTKLTINAYHKNVAKGIIEPTCNNISEVLEQLRNRGIKLAIVTTDDSFITQKCLETLGIDTYFDAVYTDDGTMPTKPEPDCLYDFCEKQGLTTSEVIMVGDTLTDVFFAKNGGIKVIGVAKNNVNRKILSGQADVVIPDISHIFEVLE